jgi:hypothetical protein
MASLSLAPHASNQPNPSTSPVAFKALGEPILYNAESAYIRCAHGFFASS